MDDIQAHRDRDLVATAGEVHSGELGGGRRPLVPGSRGNRRANRRDRRQAECTAVVSVTADAAATPITFADLYASEFAPLVRLATLLTGRSDAARDVVQDAFVSLHVRWATVRNPPAYVRRSVVNGCASFHRRERRRHTGEPPEQAVAFDVDHTLATLATLGAKERAMVVLKFYEGRNEHEIAEIVGCRPGSVGPTVQRALAKLREQQS